MSSTTNEVPVIGKWLTLAIPIYRRAGFGRKTQQDLLVRHRNRPFIEKISERLGKSLSAVPVAQVNLFGFLQNHAHVCPSHLVRSMYQLIQHSSRTAATNQGVVGSNPAGRAKNQTVRS